MKDYRAIETGVEVPAFGVEVSGVSYILRPGAYGVLERNGCIAVVEGPNGLYLPGGGVDGDESPEATLVREVYEECGVSCAIGRYLGQAYQFVYSETEQRHFKKHGYFFCAGTDSFNADLAAGAKWLATELAVEALVHGSHQWAVQRWISTG